MTDPNMPLEVIAAHFGLLDPERQRDTAYLCLFAAVKAVVERDPEEVSSTEYEHIRYAVAVFEEGLFSQSIRQLVLAQQTRKAIEGGAAFAPVGRKYAFRLAMLRRRMELQRLLAPAGLQAKAS
jgi:hypothetical protein